MAKMIINGEVCSGSSSYASAVEYIKDDGSKSTVQNEISEIRNEVSEQNKKSIKYIDTTLRADGNATAYIEGLNNNICTVTSVRNWSNDYLLFIPMANNKTGTIALKILYMFDLSPAKEITVDARVFYCDVS